MVEVSTEERKNDDDARCSERYTKDELDDDLEHHTALLDLVMYFMTSRKSVGVPEGTL